MNFIIKSLRENIYINIIILMFFLIVFLKSDFVNIVRYLDGYKYPSTSTRINVKFTIMPNDKILAFKANSLLESMINEHLSQFDTGLFKDDNNNSTNYGFNIRFNTDDMEKSEIEIRKFIDLYMQEFRNFIIDTFEFDNSVIFLNDTLYERLKEYNIAYKDYVVFNLNSFERIEELKLGQTEKILLSKLIFMNFLFCILNALLFCLIFSILKEEFFKKKIK